MQEQKNIRTYSAADIEKYWSGKLSTAEMHAMEKAAMDDPFLSDALEGYKNAATPAADLDALKKKIDARVGSTAKVIPIGNRKFPWLRVAIAVIIIGGIGVLAQQFLLKKENEQLATSDKKQTGETAINKDAEKNDTLPATTSSSTESAEYKTEEKITTANGTASATTKLSVNDTIRETAKLSDDAGRNTNPTVETSDIKTAPAANIDAKPGLAKAKETENFKKLEIAPGTVSNDKQIVSAKSKNDAGFNDARKNTYLLNNRYNYRVVDEQNNPVPFANVTNTRDNVGTYTDIKGNFNLVSSDSLLDVQVRSLGYNADNFKLIPGNTNATIVLKEDDRRQILVENNRRVSNNVARKDSATLEEPEVGWGYYNTYVSNNIKVPDNIRSKNNSNEVELSFDIDKTGSPVNIKVTRSSGCKECDDEAKRLLKEGPKWNRKGKKSKGSVVINVD